MAKSGTKIAAVRETRKGATIYKTNERPGTRAQVKYVRVSAYKQLPQLPERRPYLLGLPMLVAERMLQRADSPEELWPPMGHTPFGGGNMLSAYLARSLPRCTS